jgi:tetratricopeptide (TPR) repeat protein
MAQRATKPKPPRFDVAALRQQAGPKVFTRGEEYHRDGQVDLLAVERDRVLARVLGSEDYRTVLRGRGKNIRGECSCPAFRDWGFCKHLVATALATNEVPDDGWEQKPSILDRIRAHLKQQGVDALVEMVVALAERDTDLFRRLEIAAAAASPGDAKRLEKQLCRAIDGATRTGGFVGPDEVDDWADEVGAALEAIAQLAGAGHGTLAMELALHAIDRIEGAIEEIDDSGGHGSGLLEYAGDIHLAACLVAKPDPITFARKLFPRQLDEQYDTFYRAVVRYAEVLGEAGLAEYRRLAIEAWEKLPPQTRKPATGGESDRLVDILDFFAERDGDVETRIALRSRNLSTSSDYLKLAKFCLAEGRAEEALRRAEEGLWMFEDGRPDERLVLFVVDLLAKAGRKEDAATHLWKAFEKSPSVDLYRQIKKLSGKAGGERALTYLEAKAAASQPMTGDMSVSTFIGILMQEKMYDAAWMALRGHPGMGPYLTGPLAEATEKTHPQEALAAHARNVEFHIGMGGSTGYKEACRLIARMAGLRDPAAQAQYVATLKERHRLKRNFIKLLE